LTYQHQTASVDRILGGPPPNQSPLRYTQNRCGHSKWVWSIWPPPFSKDSWIRRCVLGDGCEGLMYMAWHAHALTAGFYFLFGGGKLYSITASTMFCKYNNELGGKLKYFGGKLKYFGGKLGGIFPLPPPPPLKGP
jgi:hypothetical protein